MSYARELYSAFRRVNGYAIGVAGVIATVVAYRWAPSSSIQLRVLLPIAIAGAIAIITFADCSFKIHQHSKRAPRALRAVPPMPPYPDSKAVLLLEKSELFALDSVVSVYSLQRDLEVLIGVGAVMNVQENGLIQIAVFEAANGEYGDVWRRILANNKDEIEAILVKPTIPRHLMEGR